MANLGLFSEKYICFALYTSLRKSAL